MNNVATIQPRPKSVILDMSDRFGMEPVAFERTIRATVFPANGTPEQLAAFLLVAKEYKLNPITKEIYAFPAKGGGIVPIVSIDGWMNLINSHPSFDGMEFDEHHNEQGELVSTKCTIYRKDRSHPVSVTEYYSECQRNTDPWKMKHRMLRHKSAIQTARYAFGFAGIYDEDEGERIAKGELQARPTPPVPPAPVIEHRPIAEPAPRAFPPVPPVPPQPTNAAPPTPPDPRADKPIPLIEKYREAVALAMDGDALDAAFKEIIEPHMTGMDREMYEAAMALDDARRGELENAG